ncbi:hypothetical protein G7Z17_g9397 [Cylindrodendrum hubeiense]|uniref:Uncharacterized protein n=1 Tax=Cylindrodendrum hubeiense TaxID=595255 RepID=A0A9P5H0G6_9HYPO|nr:hypothetical protein G7Z17_g9397 [Cylindrodendrum hubeiense]
MDTARDFAQIGHENPRVPTSPDLDDELFDSFFDWQGYCDSTRPSDIASPPYYGRTSPRDLNKLITEIPSVIDHLSLERLESEFLRMKTSFSPNNEQATPSDYSGQTPPELIQGGSTSPSDYSGSIYLERADEARRRPEASLREVQAQDDEWTYPQTVPNKHATRGYPPRLQVQEDSSRRPFEMTSSLKRRRSGNTLERRRVVSDPDRTADVRKSGACLPCRVSKTRWGLSYMSEGIPRALPPGVYPYDPGHGLAHVWSVNPTEEERFRLEPRFFIGKPREIAILVSSRDVNSPALRATVQAYRSHDGTEENPRKAAFPRERVPGHHDLQKWVEAQIQRESSSSHFKHSLQNFLLAYSEEGHGLPRAEVRHIARKALESLEHDVFKQLDDCVAQQGPPKTQEKLAIWASMWQLMLMYRDLLNAFKADISRMGPVNDPAVAHAKSLHQWMTDKVFPLLAIFYHYQFRTKKSLDMSLDWLKSSSYPSRACHSKRIRKFTKDMMSSKKELYENIQQSQGETDRMLCALVVNHEVKKLSARRRTPKGSSKSRSSHTSDGYDDDE